MQSMRRWMGLFAASMLLGTVAIAAAPDTNITRPVATLERLLVAEPLVITEAQISRPKAKGDITLRADVSFGGAPPLRVKLRRADPGADDFNNVPRYDLAAYELQKLFLDPAEYVVPPTALRMVPLADFAKYSPDVERTFPGADQVLAVVQYWLNNVTNAEDIYSADRFAADSVYARHIGQLNVLTYIIEHRDSNLGNFLISRAQSGARVFSIDHGVAFASEDADRGELWKRLRVDRLPADTVDRLRKITLQTLTDRLGVLAQWKLEGDRFVPVAPGPTLSANRGVRLQGDNLQMGLTRREIQDVYRLMGKLLEQIDRGKITLTPAPAT